MKKIMLALMLLVTVSAASAQDFRVGVKGFFNSTWLFNNNISDYGADIDYVATFGYNSGITTAFYFTEDLGVSLDLFYAYHSQIITGSSDTASYTSFMILKYLDVPVLFKVSSEGGPYIEIGPQVSFLLNAKEVYSGNIYAGPSLSYTKDYKADFNVANISGVLGFGYDIPAGDRWQINVGLRFGYGITDVTKKFPENDAELFPLNSLKLSAGEHSTYSEAAHTAATVPHDYSYQKTSRAFGGLSLGVIYKPNK